MSKRLCYRSSFAQLSLLATALLCPAELVAQRGDRPNDAPQTPPLADLDLPPAVVVPADVAIKRLQLPAGFSATLVAAEPLVIDPVAMAFDPQGRLWVVEMPTFDPDTRREFAKLDPEAKALPEPVSRIVRLEDTNGDGIMDRRHVFMEGFAMANAVGFIGDAVLIGDPPNLILARDRDGDGVADESSVVANDYGSRRNHIEDAPNGLLWGHDNWLYNAAYTARLRPKAGAWLREPMPFFGQWGISQDDRGRLFFNRNSDQLRMNLFPAHYSAIAERPIAGVNQQATTSQTIWPTHPNPGANRSYRPGSLRPDGSLIAFTSAAAPVIYRGTNFPERYHGNAFVPEPIGNLIKRNVIAETDSQLIALEGYTRSEFLTTTDERFRPVALANGPDGNLYVVDMYRGIINGFPWITTYAREQFLERGLHRPAYGMGRIYRISYDGRPADEVVNLKTASPSEHVAALGHSNGWTRDTAQQVIVQSGQSDVYDEMLIHTLRESRNANARWHALWALEGLDLIRPDHVLLALQDDSLSIRMAALRVSEPWLAHQESQSLRRILRERITFEDPGFLVQLVLSASAADEQFGYEIAFACLSRATEHPSLIDAIGTAARGKELNLIAALLAEIDSKTTPGFGEQATLRGLAQIAIREGRLTEHSRIVSLIADHAQPRWIRAALLDGLLAAANIEDLERRGRLAVRFSPATVEPLATLSDPFIRRIAEPLVVAVRQQAERASKIAARDAAPQLTSEELDRYETGRATYLICAGCHQPEGEGREGIGPSLIGGRWATETNPDIAIRIVLHGKEGSPEFPASMMPLNTLSDEQIAGVLTFIRRSWGNSASAVSPTDVRRVRSTVGTRTRGWTDQELATLLETPR